MQRAACFVICLLLIFGLCACDAFGRGSQSEPPEEAPKTDGGEENTENTEAEDTQEYIWRREVSFL